MVKKLETYFDFAENDYMHFKFCYNAHLVSNQMGAIAQGICEKYLKHIIEKYAAADTAECYDEKEKILRTHNLGKLLRYMQYHVPDFQIDGKKLKIIDGFYFTARYPGEESICINEDDIEDCNLAVEECRSRILAYVKDKACREEKINELVIEEERLPKKPAPKIR